MKLSLYDNVTEQVMELLGDTVTSSGHSRRILRNIRCSRRSLQDVGEHHMILRSEQAFELGGTGFLGLSGCLSTSGTLPLREGVYLLGEDLGEIRQDRSYARVVLLKIRDESEETEQELYRRLRQIDYVRYHVHPEGYMSRISPVEHREPVRIGKKARKQGLSLGDVGEMYRQAYQMIPGVEQVVVCYITEQDFDYPALDRLLQRAEQITESLNHIFSDLTMDCQSCHLKPVCDEVEELRELHFKRSKEE